ncbi:hypothetical protein SAMN05421507_11814 [Lentzea jiangxiensis]|uniref:Uncharacterized protein n=1 Tax=Lentzea jiangxiensis TaxID=641025 RepID=A0A1H0WAM9_9PSEU|nr:hypothetical protein SAMN05421507_11814 [Lentzea jiangxiensis]
MCAEPRRSPRTALRRSAPWTFVVLAVDGPAELPQADVDRDDRHGPGRRDGVQAGTCQRPHRRGRAPERGRGVEPAHRQPVAQDHVRARTAGRTTRPHRDDGVGPQNRHPRAVLPLETDQRAEAHAPGDAQRHVEDVHRATPLEFRGARHTPELERARCGDLRGLLTPGTCRSPGFLCPVPGVDGGDPRGSRPRNWDARLTPSGSSRARTPAGARSRPEAPSGCRRASPSRRATPPRRRRRCTCPTP